MKPTTLDGYDKSYTLDCERLLVTLIRGLGPWKESIVLVGGLTPRYLVKAKPPAVPEHAGTQDVDVVVDLQILADVDAYHTLEDNLKKLGFERGTNSKNQKVSWRWEVRTEHNVLLRLELLADHPDMKGGKVEALPTEGSISALNVPHSSMVFDHFRTVEITAESLGGNGILTETVKYADLVAFTTLKALAYTQRWERKDAHDLVYCLDHYDPQDSVPREFQEALTGKHGDVVRQALSLLRHHFCDDQKAEGYLKDGPVAVAKFELDENDPGTAEPRMLRQREASFTVTSLLGRVGV
jgi:hypothetical protein